MGSQAHPPHQNILNLQGGLLFNNGAPSRAGGLGMLGVAQLRVHQTMTKPRGGASALEAKNDL